MDETEMGVEKQKIPLHLYPKTQFCLRKRKEGVRRFTVRGLLSGRVTRKPQSVEEGTERDVRASRESGVTEEDTTSSFSRRG